MSAASSHVPPTTYHLPLTPYHAPLTTCCPLLQVAEAKYDFFENEWKNISDGAKDVIRRLLVADPASRMTMPQLLEHDWVKASADKCREEIERKMRAAPPTAAAAAKPKNLGPKVVSDRKLTKGCPALGCPKPCCNPKACCSIM